MSEPDLVTFLKSLMRDVILFSQYASDIRLRSYQTAVASAVVDSVYNNRGFSFVVMFPRQSGKNELQAQIETYLLTLFSTMDAEIVKVSPTWKPQSLNAMRRLERVLTANSLTSSIWHRESGYIYRVGKARIFFFTGQPEANIVGATASTLLEVDEAQDVLPSKFDKDIAPMAASTNATRVFWGTAWTSQTLLSRELSAALEAEKRDGIRRVFRITAEDVAREVPAYGQFVAGQVARLGRNNPMVRSQFFSEEIDMAGGMFPPERIALMAGSHPPQTAPTRGSSYAFLIDVAGEDENPPSLISAAQAGSKRDSTTLTVVEVLPQAGDDFNKFPSYRVINRWLWTGQKHSTLYNQIKALADLWKPRAVVIDATGIGAGLASFLDRALPGRVQPFIFNQATKSSLGWNFISLVDSGRFKDYAIADSPSSPAVGLDPSRILQQLFTRQAQYCQYEVFPGPSKNLKWGVPDGSRDPANADYLHDDLLISAALSATLDDQPLLPTAETLIIHTVDPLEELSHGY